MQPSFNVSLRSLVTIASLIAIPAIAVVGVSAPRALQSTKRVYKPIVEPAAADSMPTTEMPALGDSAADNTSQHSPSSPRTAPMPAARKSPAFWDSDARAERPTKAEPSLLEHRAVGGDVAPEGGVRPARFDEQEGTEAVEPKDTPFRLRPTGARLTNGSDEPADSGALANESQDGFSVLERRLRELGATQYRLETWGEDGSLYRFRCLMAVPDRPTHNRYFEATDAEALRAMQRVLAQVERWRSQR